MMNLLSRLYRKAIELQKIRSILKNWNFESAKISELKGGKPKANWLVTVNSKKYVLQNVGSDREWLVWIVFILQQLSTHDFPYEIPNLILTAQDETFLSYHTSYWWLYEYIEGDTFGGFYSNAIQACELGVLVGEFHKAVSNLDWRNFRLYQLSLFDEKQIQANVRSLEEKIRNSNNENKNFLLETVFRFLSFYKQISQEEVEQVKELNKIPIYYDFHGDNVLHRDTQIIGLIDFDSLAIGPKVVDIQNALLYVATSNEGIDLQRVESFMKGYRSTTVYSRRELSTLPSVMYEQLFILFLRVLQNGDVDSFSPQGDSTENRFLNILNWLTSGENRNDMYRLISGDEMLGDDNLLSSCS